MTRIGRINPSSGTNKGGSTIFCAALIVVRDISISILVSARAVIDGDLPYPTSNDDLRYLGQV